MPHQKHLHEQSQARGGFAWLSPPGAAALSLLMLYGQPPSGMFAGALTEVTGTPGVVWLKHAQGELIDEAMGCHEPEGLLLTCHGGAAVRRALEAELARAGLAEVAPTPFGATAFVRHTLAMLPRAQGLGAVKLVLDAAGQADALVRALEHPAAVARLLGASDSFQQLFEPPRVQLWGPVNAGKSSLLNALCGRRLAAVGAEPGLTRDIIEGRLEHDGFVLRIFDAPGTWAGVTTVDKAAQELATRWRDQADLVIELVPPGAQASLPDAISLPSQADEPGAEGVSISRPETIRALKDRLIKHFFGQLRSLPPEQRFALHPELRSDLKKLTEGLADASVLRNLWLD